MKWFRLYTEVLHDPKVQRLHPATFRHWINVLCVANMNQERGVLPPVEDVAFALRMKPVEAQKVLDTLKNVGLVEQDEDGRLFPHNWTERQRSSDAVSTRVQRHREKKELKIKGITENVTLHPRFSNALDIDTDKEKKKPSSKEEGHRLNESMPDPKTLFDLWNETVKGSSLPQAKTFSVTRAGKCKARLKERNLDGWAEIFRKCVSSPFLSGSSGRGWRADFDWIVRNADNGLKVLEGSYDDTRKRPGQGDDRYSMCRGL